MTAHQLPTLPGMVDGVVGHDLLGWTVQCRSCGATSTHTNLLLAIRTAGMHFHNGGWDDGINPRLCRDCRLARGCDCWRCQEDRRGA